MRVVYIAAPLNAPTEAEREQNRACAARWVVWAAQDVAPIATWITLAGSWPESAEHRSRGLEIDCELVGRCDELWLVGGRVSEGMGIEADEARKLGVLVRDLTCLGNEPPAVTAPRDIAQLQLNRGLR